MRTFDVSVNAENHSPVALKLGATQIAIGLVLGLAPALVLSRALGVMLFDVELWDPTIFVTVVLTLAASGLAASLIPARRATRVDPVDAPACESRTVVGGCRAA